MAATSDDDVPAGQTATGHDDSPDGDTTAAAMAPATTVPSVATDEDEDDRTVQQHIDPKIQEDRSAARAQALAARRAASSSPARPSSAASASPLSAAPLTPLAQLAPLVPLVPSTQVAPGAQVAPPAPPVRMTSKKVTAVGLGSPLSVTRSAAEVAPASAAPPAPAPASAAPSTAAAPQPTLATMTAPATTRGSAVDDDSAETIETQADAEDGSITTTSPAPRLGMKGAPLPLTLPLPLPATVQIRELPDDDEDEELDETEVRTLVGSLASEVAAAIAPVPAAGRPSEPPPTEADDPDDSVTTQAPSAVKNARLPEDEEPNTARPIMRPSAKPTPAAGRRPGEDPAPFTLDSAPLGADAYDNDESVTTRGPAVPEYEDDSVTAQAPVARTSPVPHIARAVEPSLDDGTDGTTKRVAKRVPAPNAAGAGSSHDIEDAESITTQAPGHLTNMLRVIATAEDAIDSDDSAENKTAVMPGAPVKPTGAQSTGSLRAARPILSASAGPSMGARAAAVVDLREPGSDSGLRIAHPETQGGDHASVSALISGASLVSGDGISGALPVLGDHHRSARDASPAAFANTEQAFNANPRGPQPSHREVEFGAMKKPRYGLLVGLVAVLSFTIPLVLFLWLHQGMVEDDAPPRTASEVAPDLVGRGDPTRPRVTRGGAASTSPSASPSASTSASPPGGTGNRPAWFPRRR